MTSPGALLQAIAKADPDAAAVIGYDVALQLGEEAMRAYKEEIAKALPGIIATSTAVMKRSLGRDYVERVSKGGDPQFDPELLAAYNGVAQALEVVSKATTTDTFEVKGNRITVYRSSDGRFARKGSAVPESRETASNDLLSQFYHPNVTREKGRERPTRATRALLENQPDQRKWIADERIAGAFAAPSDETDLYGRRMGANIEGVTPEGPLTASEKRAYRGLQAQMEANNLVDILEGGGVIPANGSSSEKAAAARLLKVTAQIVGENGSTASVDLQWDDTDDTFRLPETKRVGYSIADYTVGTDDDAMKGKLNNLRGGGERQVLIDLNNPLSAENLVNSRYNRAYSSGLNQSRAALAAEQIGLSGRVMRQLGIKRGKTLERGAEWMKAVEGDEGTRAAMTRTGWRFRGIDAPTLNPSIRIAVEAPKPAADGFTDAREAYYDQALPPNTPWGDGVAMGQQRDYTTVALWARQKARMSDAGMGMSGDRSNANYNALAQRIARGIGRGMPSEGVLIDRHGKAVSQSMGITHDGFLPFNADALGKLSGGQYVRSRQLGGFTGEDLRTLLVGNGRAAQVVSNSGVYELEMDPSLRGSRRYNDTAMQMIDTYDRILDEIESGGLYAVPLPAENERKAREQASMRAGNAGDYDAYLEAARHEQYNALAQVSATEVDTIRQQMTPQLRAEYAERFGPRDAKGRPAGIIPSTPSNDEKQFIETRVAEAASEASEQKARMLSLNSEGYALALKTLQQFYPYMIRTARYRDWETFNAEASQSIGEGHLGSPKTRKGKDAWTTRRGSLRPIAAGRVVEEDVPFSRTGQPAMGRRTREAEGFNPALRTIRPGGKVNVAASGGTASTAAAAAGSQQTSSRFQSQVAATQRAVGAEIQAFGGIQREGTERSEINDAAITAATGEAKKIRMVLELFAKDPKHATRVMRESGGPELANMLTKHSVAQAIVNDTDNPVSDAKGNRATAEQVYAIMQGVSASIAAEMYSGSVTNVDDGIESISAVPDGDGPVMIDEKQMTSRQVAEKIASSAPLRSALAKYQAVVAETEISHINPYVALDSLQKAKTESEKVIAGDGYDQSVMEEFQSAGNDSARVDVLSSHGAISAEQAKNAKALLSKYEASQVLTGQDPERFSAIRNGFRLGHGLWMQQFIHRQSADPDSRSALKARGPAMGLTEEEYGKSSDWGLDADYLAQTLALVLSPSRLLR